MKKTHTHSRKRWKRWNGILRIRIYLKRIGLVLSVRLNRRKKATSVQHGLANPQKSQLSFINAYLPSAAGRIVTGKGAKTILYNKGLLK